MPALLEDELVVLELGVVVVELLLSVWDELLVLSETLTLMSVSDWEHSLRCLRLCRSLVLYPAL